MTTVLPSTVQDPAPAVPLNPDAAPVEAKPKERQRFTLTRARDLDAKIDAIVLRAKAGLADLADVGIDPAGDVETNAIRESLRQLAIALAEVVDGVGAHATRTGEIVELLEQL